MANFFDETPAAKPKNFFDETPDTPPPAPTTPWFSAGPGNDKIGEFFAKAGDTATFGLGAKLQDALGIGQKDGQTVAQQVANAGEDIGPIASAGADVLGYMAGPGELRVGEGLSKLAGSTLGGNLAARIGGRMVGSGIEGTGATILGAAGHDQDLTPGGLAKSAALSTILGALPGGGGDRPVTPTTGALKTNMQNAFDPLESTWVNSRNTGQNFNAVTSSLPTRVDIGDTLNGKIDQISKEIGDSNGVLSADTVARYQRSLMKAARGNASDQNVAGNYIDALNTSLGPTNADAVSAANTLANKYKTSREIDKWMTDPTNAPAAIKGALAKKPQFYQSEPGLPDALGAVGKMADPPGPIQSAANTAARAGWRGLVGAGLGTIMGGNSGIGAVQGVMDSLVFPHVAQAVNANKVKLALQSAKHLNATGQIVAPDLFKTPGVGSWLGDLMRQGGYSAGAAGSFGSPPPPP